MGAAYFSPPASPEEGEHQKAGLEAEIRGLYARREGATPGERSEINAALRRKTAQAAYLKRWLAAESRKAHRATSWALLARAARVLRARSNYTDAEVEDLVREIEDHVPADYRARIP